MIKSNQLGILVIGVVVASLFGSLLGASYGGSIGGGFGSCSGVIIFILLKSASYETQLHDEDFDRIREMMSVEVGRGVTALYKEMNRDGIDDNPRGVREDRSSKSDDTLRQLFGVSFREVVYIPSMSILIEAIESAPEFVLDSLDQIGSSGGGRNDETGAH